MTVDDDWTRLPDREVTDGKAFSALGCARTPLDEAITRNGSVPHLGYADRAPESQD